MNDQERQRIQDKLLKASEKTHDEAVAHNEQLRAQQEHHEKAQEKQDKENRRDSNRGA